MIKLAVEVTREPFEVKEFVAYPRRAARAEVDANLARFEWCQAQGRAGGASDGATQRRQMIVGERHVQTARRIKRDPQVAKPLGVQFFLQALFVARFSGPLCR